MSPRKLVSLPRQTEFQGDKVATQANEPPRFLFVDDLSTKKRDPKAGSVKSFIQSEYHRKRRKAALSKLNSSSSAEAPGKIARAAKDGSSKRECPNCRTAILGKRECEACNQKTGSRLSPDGQLISGQIYPYWPIGDREHEMLLGFIPQPKLKNEGISNPKTPFGAGTSDPFRTLPGGDGMDVFIDTFLSLDQRLFGAPKNSKLMPTRDFTFLLGRDDPATLMAIMAYGAALIPSASHQAIVLKGRAIRMVNERLAHVDSALIHAISHLWLLESRYGTPQAAQWHAQAISKLIASRGGYTALGVTLGLHIGWCVLATAEPINLTPHPDSSFMTHSFAEFLFFCEFIHELAIMPAGSPYAAESSGFARPHRLHLLFAGEEEISRYHTVHPRLYPLCRLVSLLYIHCIFTENHDSPGNLSMELERARRWVQDAQLLERYVTMEMLPCVMAVTEDKTKFHNLDRSLRVLRMTMVIKMFGIGRLQMMIEMLYGYVNGKKYDKEERDRVWDPRALEREFYQTIGMQQKQER